MAMTATVYARRHENPRLSDIFTSNLESFQSSYQQFICGQEEAVKLLNEQLKCNARFAEQLARVLENFNAKELIIQL